LNHYAFIDTQLFSMKKMGNRSLGDGN